MQDEKIARRATKKKFTTDIKLHYICPYWGQEHLDAEHFIDKVIENDFDGIEINLPEAGMFSDCFVDEIDDIFAGNPDFILILQQLNIPDSKNIGDYIKGVKKKLLELSSLRPTFINSHTGKDYFSFDDNCRVIEACMNISSKTGVRILHETHRGRFSFHPVSLLPFLKKFPELELVADFSHFCTASESMLQGQEQIMQQIIPHVAHIHARVGWEQGPQVNDPFAPEWNSHLLCFKNWWQQIIDVKKKADCNNIAITPEFGPPPYMPVLAYTNQPIANQWQININMMNYLKENIAV